MPLLRMVNIMFKYKQKHALCILLILFLSFDLIFAKDDLFYCSKTKQEVTRTRRRKTGGNDDMRLLEERIAALENRIEQTQVPTVIKIQSTGIPRDCTEIFQSGVKTDGIYRISPDGRCPFDVYCDMQNGGWTVVQRRKFGNIRFDRKWEEYAYGFGELNYDFWLGLDKMHRLTKGGAMLKIVMEHYNETLPPDWAQYSAFVIGNVMSGYEMNVDTYGYVGTIKESLSYHNGMKFSAIDRDEDRQQNSCSQLYGGAGWWFTSCYRLGLLNGVYDKVDKGGISYWEDGDIFVKNAEMKIKTMERSC